MKKSKTQQTLQTTISKHFIGVP